MNINLHNYEEFFILYWDNELNTEQRNLVEIFVEANKDLQEEFRLFGETRFTPDKNMVFDEKDLLLVSKNSLIDFSNYPEQLLSYIDDELTDNQKSAIEKFTAKHPVVQQELILLKKTKLQPEPEVVFPDKNSLFRREEKIRVINMNWMRVAVAAALILIAGFVTIRVLNNKTTGNTAELVLSETPNNKKISPVINEQQTNTDVKKEEHMITAAPVKKAIQKNPVENLIAKNIVVNNAENKNNLPKVKISPESALIAQQTNPKQPAETIFPDNIDIDNNAIALAKQNSNNKLFENSTVTERPAPSYAIYDASDDPNENVDKGGLKGLLRKATRVFERHTKIQATSDDDKLLIGVFAVSLK